MISSTNRLIYALLVGFALFLIGGAGLLWVDNRRIERRADELNDLRLHLNGRDNAVRHLQQQLRACCPDSSQTTQPTRTGPDVPGVTPPTDTLIQWPY